MDKGSLHPIARFQQLAGPERALLLRALALLTLSSVAISLLPFRRALRFGAVEMGQGASPTVKAGVWAVEAAARRLPLRTMCIEKGIALQRLLRRAGHDARLHYGARHNPQNGALEAHVWVSVEGVVIIGGEEAAGFAEVAVFP